MQSGVVGLRGAIIALWEEDLRLVRQDRYETDRGKEALACVGVRVVGGGDRCAAPVCAGAAGSAGAAAAADGRGAVRPPGLVGSGRGVAGALLDSRRLPDERPTELPSRATPPSARMM